MKYIANPVQVDAFVITKVEWFENYAASRLTLDDGRVVMGTPEMQSRMVPKEGDYWVVQADGYIYLNPKEVFERKYRQLDGEPFKP